MDTETAPFLISTAAFALADKLDGFRETFGRKILHLEITPLSGDDLLDIEMTVRGLPSVSIADGHTSPVRAVHLSKLAENDDLIFTLVRSGTASWTQKSLDANVLAGQGVLTGSGVVGSFVAHTPCRLLNLRFNRQKIAARLSDADAALAQPVPGDNQALRLLTRTGPYRRRAQLLDADFASAQPAAPSGMRGTAQRRTAAS